MATEPIEQPPAPPTQLEVLAGRLTAYLAAERKILEAQSYQVGDGAAARALQRARLEEVRRAIAEVQGQMAALTPGRRRIHYIR